MLPSLRRKLGTGADGEPLFPLGRDHQYVYRLSHRVVTDWDRFVDFVSRADAIADQEGLPLLDRALALVDGPPFRAPTGYSWAYSDGTATLITDTVQAVSRRAVQLHSGRGDDVAVAVEYVRVVRQHQVHEPERRPRHFGDALRAVGDEVVQLVHCRRQWLQQRHARQRAAELAA